ncbi:MAG: M20 family metallopeptidase [Desulfotignum sp.]
MHQKKNGHCVKTWLTRHISEMYRLLANLVNIQSGTWNKKGVDRVCLAIRLEMESMGCACQTIAQTDYGNHLVARYSGTARKKTPVLITGHMDTVFPTDTDFTTYSEDGTRCFGPGTADMKGGLVVGISALKALIETRCPDIPPIVFVFNSDEEIGSPSSRQLILDLARECCMGFVLEAGGSGGEIVVARKGNLSVQIDVEGKSGHAAFAGRDKASAILELAHKTIAIEALHRPDQGVCANVGKVSGGIGPNTVAPHARAAVDFRFATHGDKTRLIAALDRIINTPAIPRTRTTLTGISQRPPMPETPAVSALFTQIQTLGNQLGVPVVPEHRQGVSDANIIARAEIPVIDGLGPIGGNDHSPEEYIIKQSLMDRTRLFAHILTRCQPPTRT